MSGLTFTDALVAKLNALNDYNRSVFTPPAAILWPDKARQFEPVIDLIRDRIPYFITFGDYNPQNCTGPAIWIRCLLARIVAPADEWPANAVPVIYLPGISRSMLCAIDACPDYLKPLAELQYRGAIFSQRSGRDWTLNAFMITKDGGLDLDVIQDTDTIKAMQRALNILMDTPLDRLTSKQLDAGFFNQLIMPDPVRDVLHWLNDPEGIKKIWKDDQWETFCEECKARFNFDPRKDDPLTAAEFLGQRKGSWKDVWDRYVESPRSYPAILSWLEKAQPGSLPIDLFTDQSTWPKYNDQQEDHLRGYLIRLANMPEKEVRENILTLESTHGKRRSWVWFKLDRSPLAGTIQYLAQMAKAIEHQLPGNSLNEIIESYRRSLWEIDDAAIQALTHPKKPDDIQAVTTAIRSIYLPWLERINLQFQNLVKHEGYPVNRKTDAPVKLKKGEVLLFVDGLRMDAAWRVKKILEEKGCLVDLSSSWAAFPSVTATSKYAQSPIRYLLEGLADTGDFNPSVKETQTKLNTNSFRKLMNQEQVDVFGLQSTGNPDEAGWTEIGDIDKTGHDQGWKLAKQMKEKIQDIIFRITDLFEAGWKVIRIVTDHGWLLMPGGLPKTQLHSCLVSARWARCAILKDTSHTEMVVLPWYWSDNVQIATGPGINCFIDGKEYDHGGLSLQECIIPNLEIRPGKSQQVTQIENVDWRGLRCYITIKGDTSGLVADIRKKFGDAGSSLVLTQKPFEGEKVSLLVEEEDFIGSTAFVVVLDEKQQVIAKKMTFVGGGD